MITVTCYKCKTLYPFSFENWLNPLSEVTPAIIYMPDRLPAGASGFIESLALQNKKLLPTILTTICTMQKHPVIWLISTILIFHAVSLTAAGNYSEDRLRIEQGWGIEFENGSTLTVSAVDPDRIVITQRNSAVSTKFEMDRRTFTSLDQEPFKTYTRQRLQEQKRAYLENKRAFDAAEHKRVEQIRRRNEINKKRHEERIEQEYQQAMSEYQAALKSMKDELKTAIKQENEKRFGRFQEENERYSNKLREYEAKKEKHDSFVESKAEYLNCLEENRDAESACASEKEKMESLEDRFLFVFSTEPADPGTFDESRPEGPKLIEESDFERFKREKPDVYQDLYRSIAKPEKSKEPFIPEDATKRSFGKNEPQADDAPGFDLPGLALLMTTQDCREMDLKLKLGKKVYPAQSDREPITGFSPWEGEQTPLTKCVVTTRDEAPAKTLAVLTLQKDRLLSMDSLTSRRRVVKRIFSPEFLAFRKSCQGRAFEISDIDAFRRGSKGDIISANYLIEGDNTSSIQVEYSLDTVSKKDFRGNPEKKPVVNVLVSTPVYIYESSQKDKRVKVHRISQVEAEIRKDARSILMDNQVVLSSLKEPKEKLSFATCKYSLNHIKSEGTVRYLLEKEDGIEVVSRGYVYDFTSLWYIVPFLSKQRFNEFPIDYFNDSTVTPMNLIKKDVVRESASPDFLQPFSRLERWELVYESQPVAQYYVADNSHVLVKVTFDKHTINLFSISNGIIDRNFRWKKGQIEKHGFVKIY